MSDIISSYTKGVLYMVQAKTYMGEIVSSYAKGEKIEYRKKAISPTYSNVWRELKEPNFNFVDNEYRVYKEPSYMKLGRAELYMLRRDYTELVNSYSKEDLATATVRYNIFQIRDLIDTLTNMKSFIINQMPLKESYKEELEAYKMKYGELDSEE